MKRKHLFEFEDQKWFPSFLRNYMTDFLEFLANKAKVYQPVIDEIHEMLEQSNQNQIIDMGSGSGGGLVWLAEELRSKNKELKITLTDLYPNIMSFKHVSSNSDSFDYYEQPVDATNVPQELKGMRTMFLSFHHLKPEQAVQVIQNAVDANQAIATFEIQDRTFVSLLVMAFSPLSVLLTTPFVRPFRLGRIVFTYLIPILPLVVLWDGIVSCIRTYSADEMRELVNKVQNKEKYNWTFKKKKAKGGFVIYMSGIPRVAEYLEVNN